MSEIMSDLDRSAAAYWMRVARTSGPDAGAALSTAQRLVVESRAERQLPDNGQTPTLDQIEAAPIRYRP